MNLQITSLVLSVMSLPVGWVIADMGKGPGMQGMGPAIFSLFFMIVTLLVAFLIAVVAACLPIKGRSISFLTIPLPLILGLWGIPALMG
jgi:hypothetical protein